MTSKPPLTVTGMRWMVLILATWNLLRAGFAIANWNTLQEFAPPTGAWYATLTGSFWTLAGLAVLSAIHRRNVHAQGWYALTLFGYAAWWWADRVFVAHEPRPNTLFAAGITIGLLISVAIDFFNKKAADYFTQRETNEQPTNQQTS